MITKETNIIIIGPSGSGKGTQAEFISEKFGQKHIIVGDILREISEKDTELGKAIKEKITKGEWLDDQTTNQILEEVISKIDKNQGFILDGSPRTLNQAKFLEEFFEKTHRSKPIVVNLQVSPKEVFKRLINRKICEKCGELYHPPKSFKFSSCEKCGGKLVRRADDNQEAIQKRLDEYEQEVKPVINFYREQKRVIDINGEPKIPQVWAEIKEKLENYGSN